MSINLDDFPKFSEEHFHDWVNQLTPIEEYKGYRLKRDDQFHLGGVSGGKVRQCAKLVYDNLDHIKNDCNGGILTAAGIPSPQSCITSAVAKYFGLKCIITIPHYPDHIRDSYRINASLSQKFGAKVYGVGNPNISGPELDAKKLVVETGYFQIKFGMNGFQVMNTVAQQVKNIPDDVETVVGIAGSGLSMLGVAMGCKIWNKNVKTIYPVALSDYVNKNMEATKIHGHVINIGRLAGMSGNFNYDLHAKRRLHYVGTTGRTRSLEENEMVATLANNDLWASVLAGKIRHVIYSKLHLTKAKEALDIMNKNSHFGKIILFTDEFTNKDNIVN